MNNDAKLNPILHNLKDTKDGEFKRPDHPDFLTSKELREKKFSGIRDHRMAMCYEIWITGDMVKVVRYAEVEADSKAVDKAFQSYFS